MIRLFAALAPLALAAAFVSSTAAAEEKSHATIAVTGNGRSAAAPDLATITLGVETRGDDAAAALAENNEKARALIEAAEAAGVADRDVQTSGLTLFPIYEQRRPGGASEGAPKLVGFQVGNEVRLRLREIDKVGETLTALIAAGANQMRGVAFAIDDDQALRDEARRAAVADARRKAELYAEAAGVRLGPIVSITEGGGGGGPVFEAARSFAVDAVPVAAGETSVSASVRIVWRIGE